MAASSLVVQILPLLLAFQTQVPVATSAPDATPEPAATPAEETVDAELSEVESTTEEPVDAAQTLAPAAPRDQIGYRMDVEADGRFIRGWAEVEVTVAGERPLEDLVFLLYPNRYRDVLPGVNDINFVRVYPKASSSGRMTVKADVGTLEEHEAPGHQEGTVTRLVLPEPVPVGETVRVVLTFETEVPEKFGSFGYWREFLLVNGGWYPALAPRDADGAWAPGAPAPLARYQVRLKAPADHWVLLDDEILRPRDGRTEISETTIESCRYLLLGVAGELHEHARDGQRILQADAAKRHADRQLKIWMDARTWLTELQGRTSPDVTAVETYLPRQLMFPNSPLPLVSYRTYRINPPLRRYHHLHIARTYFAGAVREHVGAMEVGTGDDAWLQEGLSWELAEFFILDQGKIKDPRAYMRNLAWIPAVDLVLYSARFPFAAEYYGNFYWTDPLRDDPTRYGHRRPNGHVVLEKLRDRFGNDTVKEIITRYLAARPEDGGFRRIAEQTTGEDLHDFFELWRSPLPFLNYAVTDVKTRKHMGQYLATVELQRTGPPVSEPVKIRLETRKGKKEIVWNPNGDEEEELEISLKAPVKKVQLDPGNRLLETVRWDNRYPRAWKFVLQYFYVDIDYKIGEASGAAGLELQRTWDKRNEIDAAVFWTQQSLGAEIGYVRSFGPETWYRSLLHRVGVFLLVERLDQGFARGGLNATPNYDPNRSEVEATMGLVLAYRYDDRLDFRWPRSGTRFSAALEGGYGVPNRHGLYLRTNLRAIHLRRVTDHNVVAFQAKAGTLLSAPEDVPLPKLFFMGGISDLRGMSEPEFVGPTRVLLSAEWRWFAIRNLDWDLWFARIRGIQPAFFTDVGYLAAEKFGETLLGRVTTVPPFIQWRKDVGVAVRIHWDALGVRPMLLRLDFAQRYDHWLDGATVKPDVRFYTGLGQSF